MFFDKISTIIGFIQVIIYKLFYYNRIFFNGFLKIKRGCKIIIEKNSKIKIGKNVKIRYHASLKAEKGGCIDIGDDVFINDGANINSLSKIKIGNNVHIGHNVVILDHNHDYKNDFDKFVVGEIKIEDNVWIGANVTVLKGVTIGKNSVIAANTLINKSIPANSLIYDKKNQIIREIENG